VLNCTLRFVLTGEVAVAIFKSLDNDGSGELLLDEFRQGDSLLEINSIILLLIDINE
jgi:hypothetical protein